MSAVLDSPDIETSVASAESPVISHAEMYRWTVEQYQQMVEVGILTPDDRVELLEGLVVAKMTNNPRHSEVIEQMSERLFKLVPDAWSVRVQLPIQSIRSQPEPDFAIVRKNRDRGRHPMGAETLLVIEVADSSIGIDREKAAIYSRAGVPAYWIINIPELRVESYGRLNSASGEYDDASLIHHLGDVLSLETPTGTRLEFSVQEMLSNS